MLLAEMTNDGPEMWIVLGIFVSLVSFLLYSGVTETRRQNAIVALVRRGRMSGDKEADRLVDTWKQCDDAIDDTERSLKYASAVERYDLETALAKHKEEWRVTREKLEKRLEEVSGGNRLRVVA